MKILMFGWEFPPHITGGLGTACYGLTKGLIKKGVEVIFVVPKAYGDENSDDMRLVNASDVNIDIRDISMQKYWKMVTYMEIGSNLVPYISPEEFEYIKTKSHTDVNTVSKSVFTRNFKFSGKYGHDLLEEVSRYAIIAAALAVKTKFDVIHAHDWLTYPAGIAAKKVSGKPLIVHVHATEFDRSGENINHNVYEIERKGMHAADKVITVSYRTRDIVINRYGVDPSKVVAIHNAVDPLDYSNYVEVKKHVKEKIVTFLGRVTFQKGPDYFVEAAYKVLRKDSNVRFVMAGEGDMLYRMITRVAQLRLGTKFHFTGFLKGDSVDRLLSMSDVYVMPSVSEPFGISPLEAMQSNVPVIISKQSGVAEVIKYALKVDFWDIDAMADSIYGLLHYDALSKMFLRLGKEEIDNMKWENTASHVKDVYSQLLN